MSEPGVVRQSMVKVQMPNQALEIGFLNRFLEEAEFHVPFTSDEKS